MEQFMDANEIFQALMTQKNKPMADVDGIIQVIEQVAKVMQTGKGKVDADLVAKVRKGKRPDTIKLINQIVDGNERQFLDEVWGIACMLSPNKYDILPVRSYWEKIKNHISGVWNSSDIGLDLGKLHNQIQTLEHSRLDFTAAGAANDFFHSFSNFISGKNILSTIFSYAAVASLVLLLIIILPCIVRTL